MEVVSVDEAKLYESAPPNTRLNKILVDKESVPECKNISMGLGIYREGEKAEMHSHAEEEEVMYFLEGEGKITLADGTEQKLEEGIITYCPPGEEHKIENTGAGNLVFIFVYSPPGPETGIRGWKVAKE